MTLTIKHTKVATFADQPGVEINKGEWNDDHQITGVETLPGGSVNEIQYKTALGFSGMSGAKNDANNSGFVNIGEFSTTDPAAPSSGVTVFSRMRAGKSILSGINAAGSMSEYQALLGAKRLHWDEAVGGGSSTATTFGFSTAVASGTGSAAAFDGSTLLASFNRISLTTAASAGQIACRKPFGRVCVRGSVAGAGGFLSIFRWAMEGNLTGSALFAGGDPTTVSLTNVDPSTLVNICGFGADPSDNNMQWMVNDGAGTATKVDLGSSFPAKTTGIAYEARIYCKPNDTVIYYSLERFDVSPHILIEGSSNTDLPGANTALNLGITMLTRAATNAITLGYGQITAETDM